MKSVLITGASGFVGKVLLQRLGQGEYFGKYVSRHADVQQVNARWKNVCVGEINVSTNWSDELLGIDTVIHLAARVHLMQDTVSDPLVEFRKVNTDGTLNLARQAAIMGVKRFIFISSIKVNGEFTKEGIPFTGMDTPVPQDPYGVSKFEAEQGLLALAKETGMEAVIIRPPLVYGSGVKANFLKMMMGLNKGLPLPLGAVHNKRSLVALDNLIDLIVTCIAHPLAANQTFLVSDDDDMSTTELLQRMAAALGKPARLLTVPEGWLKAGASLLGKKEVAQRLLGSLQVDISNTKERLAWTPPVSVDDALKKTAEDFLMRQK